MAYVRLTSRADLAWTLIAVTFMLVGVVLIFAGSSAGLAIAVIAVGIGIVAIREIDKRCRGAG
jgi:uncharacterized membrane protein